MTVSILAGPSRWGQAPGRSAAHGRLLAGPVDPVRIPPLALDPYLVEQRYHRQHLRIFGVSNFVILDACLRPTHCWGVLAGLCVRCGRPESYFYCITYLVSYFVLHTGLVSSFGGCMAQASYFDTARRPVSFLAKKARFVTTSKA